MQPFAYRLLDPLDLAEARALAEAVGAHGTYVRNGLEADDLDNEVGSSAEGGGGQAFGLYGSAGLLGLVYFGGRGNLIVLQVSGDLDPERLAGHVASTEWPWRIALASTEVIAGLRSREEKPPLVDREQVYYEVDVAGLAAAGDIDRREGGPAGGAYQVRVAQRLDAKALMDAALDLNESDLNVAPWRVHRKWLRDTVRRRIRERRTFVLGPVGAPLSKLDLGSVGIGGVVLEGVHTPKKHRGRGLAASLVAAVAREQLQTYPRVCLHVAGDNTAARRAYERAGMREVGRCSLMLRG